MRGAARLGPSVDEVVARLQPGDIAVIDAVDLTSAQAQQLLSRHPGAVVSIGSLDAQGAVLAPLADAGIPIVEQTGAQLWAAVGEGSTLVVDRSSGEVRDAEERVLARAVVRPPAAEAVPLNADGARAAQLLRDAATLIPELPVLDDPGLLSGLAELQAATRPIAVVGAGSFDVRLLRAWAGRTNPVVIVTPGGLPSVERAGRRVDVLVGRGVSPSDVERVKAAIYVDAGEPRSVPDEAVGLLVAAAGGSPVVTTWGLPAGRDDLLALPREPGAHHLAATLRSGLRPVDGPTLARSTSRPSPWGGLLVALAGLATAAAILALSDPGLTLLHRITR